MRLSMIVNPFTDQNLALAAQVGVSDIVIPYPGLELDCLKALKARVEAHGLRMTHIERKIPHLAVVHNLPGADEQIAGFKMLIRNMAEVGMEVLCYNWMPDEDWQRTTCEVPERGGSRVTAFRLADLVHSGNITDAQGRPSRITPEDQLWENLERFLESVVPVAEDAGIKLALHPDDPPLPVLRGQPRIIISNEAFQRAVNLVPSPASGICYCVGSYAPAGIDLEQGIRKLAEKIFFFHARNVRGTAEDFQETWHDNGEVDMVGIIRTLHEVGYRGTIRPDHAPSMAGETNSTPGYEMLGRLFAAGYLRGLIQSARWLPKAGRVRS